MESKVPVSENEVEKVSAVVPLTYGVSGPADGPILRLMLWLGVAWGLLDSVAIAGLDVISMLKRGGTPFWSTIDSLALAISLATALLCALWLYGLNVRLPLCVLLITSVGGRIVLHSINPGSRPDGSVPFYELYVLWDLIYWVIIPMLVPIGLIWMSLLSKRRFPAGR
ncbi:MAG: hypothetical protein ACFCVE_04725 [Phycisphaerae bacterium]